MPRRVALPGGKKRRKKEKKKESRRWFDVNHYRGLI
jgi:hypothetical protein